MQPKIENLEKIFTYSKDKKTVLFTIKVKAGAKCNSMENVVFANSLDKEHIEDLLLDKDKKIAKYDSKNFETSKPYLKINIKAPPVQGKANKEIIKFLSEEWSLPKSSIKIIRGISSNYKVIAIDSDRFL